jgi:hypothetical protein
MSAEDDLEDDFVSERDNSADAPDNNDNDGGGQSRRRFLGNSGKAVAGAKYGVAALGGAGGITGLGALVQHFTDPRYLPDVDKPQFKRDTDALMDETAEIKRDISDQENNLENHPISLDQNDYDERGLMFTEDILMAVPSDDQSFTIQRELGEDSREYQFLEGTETYNPDELVEEIEDDLGTNDGDLDFLRDSELIETASNITPYFGARVLPDGSQGQPKIGEEQEEEFMEYREELKEIEEAYSEALSELSTNRRELTQQRNTLSSSDRAKVGGLLPIVGDSGYKEDEHFKGPEAEDEIEEIENHLGEKVEDRYNEATQELGLIKGLRKAADHVASQIDEAQDVYDGGEFDESGQRKDEYDSTPSGRNCDISRDRAIEIFEDKGGYSNPTPKLEGDEWAYKGDNVVCNVD